MVLVLALPSPFNQNETKTKGGCGNRGRGSEGGKGKGITPFAEMLASPEGFGRLHKRNKFPPCFCYDFQSRLDNLLPSRSFSGSVGCALKKKNLQLSGLCKSVLVAALSSQRSILRYVAYQVLASH